MTRPTTHRDMIVALLIAVVAHVGLFFLTATAVANDLVKGKAPPKKEKKEKKKTPPPIQMQLQFADEVGVSVEEEGAIAVVEPMVEPEPEPKVEPINPESAFVQTQEDQAVEEAPEDAKMIGDRNTKATSDDGAEAGDETLTALAGEKERKSDPKTFDSPFSKGEDSGPTDAETESLETENGQDQVNQELVESVTDKENPAEFQEVRPKVEETMPTPPTDQIPTIDNALAILEEELRKDQKEMPIGPPTEEKEEVEEAIPERPASEQKEASNQDGGFATNARKTRIAGVISANGKGSLDVADTAAGRYQAAIFKELEMSWQMKNLQNRSLLAPGHIKLYFVVDKNGKVSRQKQVAMVGASGTQWGLVLRSLGEINIPKMPKAVVKELDDDPLEVMVTFNY